MPRLFELLSGNTEKRLRDKYKGKSGHGSQKGRRFHQGTGRHKAASRATPGRIIPDYVAIDVETTGLDHRSARIIEVGAVRFMGGKPGKEFTSLVNPQIEIPPEITRLTGISQSEVENAPLFSGIAQQLLDFIGDYPICGHQVEFDRNFLNEEFLRLGKEKLRNPLLDSAVFSRLALVSLGGYSLTQVASELGIELQNAHRALDDARASGSIITALVPKLNEIAPHVRHAMALFAPAGVLKTILFNSVGRKRQAPPVRRQRPAPLPKALPEPEKVARIDKEDVRKCFESDGKLAQIMNDYSPRTAQIDMALAATDCLNKGSYLIAEAGTGVGKSMAYLIPGALWAYKNKTRLLVSSYTRNMGDQLVRRDLPAVKKILGDDFSYSVLKGRANYLCINRWKRLCAGRHGNLSPRERFAILPLMRWAEETESGDIEGQNLFNRRWFSKVWNLISAESHDCEGWRCPFSNICYLQRARRKAQGSHVVVINHSLFFSEICAESSFLGKMGPIVFDEAHHLEACGHRHLRVELDTNRANRFIDSLDSLLHALQKGDVDGQRAEQIKQMKSAIKRLRKSIPAFLADCFVWVKRTYSDMAVAYQYAYRDEPFAGSPALASLGIDIAELADCALAFQRYWRENESEADGVFSDIIACVERTSQFKADLQYLVDAHNEDHVFWIEGNAAKGWVKLCGVPLDIGEILAGIWQQHTGGVVFTSATLSVLDSIDFFKQKAGLQYLDRSDVKFSHFASPFSPDQVFRCAVDGSLLPDAAEYSSYVADCIIKLLAAFEKNILVLFTSTAMLEKVYDIARANLQRVPDATILGQNLSGSRQVMLEQFKQLQRAALLGTDSFWEGIDVPGQECEIVVIPRLPFQVPTHPLTQAIAESYKQRYGDSFLSYSVPEAIIKFRQGAGRLIRSSSDTGALVVLDTRIKKKRYGKMFVDSLGADFVFSESVDDMIEQAEAFFK